jgi:hypothetical protein
VTEEVFTSDTYSIAEEHITTIPGGVYGVMYYQSSTDNPSPSSKNCWTTSGASPSSHAKT